MINHNTTTKSNSETTSSTKMQILITNPQHLDNFYHLWFSMKSLYNHFFVNKLKTWLRILAIKHAILGLQQNYSEKMGKLWAAREWL